MSFSFHLTVSLNGNMIDFGAFFSCTHTQIPKIFTRTDDSRQQSLPASEWLFMWSWIIEQCLNCLYPLVIRIFSALKFGFYILLFILSSYLLCARACVCSCRIMLAPRFAMATLDGCFLETSRIRKKEREKSARDVDVISNKNNRQTYLEW